MSTAALHEKYGKERVVRDEMEIRGLMDGIHRAHHDKNASPAITEPYASDAAVFNLAPPLAHRGRDLPETQEWLDTWATPVEIEARDMNVTISGDFAFANGFLRMHGTKRGAENPPAWSRMSRMPTGATSSTQPGNVG